MNEEYLPPENEQTALIAPESSELQTREEFIRIKCSMCSKEVGMGGKREHAFSLIERLGWRVGRDILCPTCVEKTARKFFKRYHSET